MIFEKKKIHTSVRNFTWNLPRHKINPSNCFLISILMKLGSNGSSTYL